jgi:hypothetical protein
MAGLSGGDRGADPRSPIPDRLFPPAHRQRMSTARSPRIASHALHHNPKRP